MGYHIDERTAKLANNMNSMSDYKAGSATAEYHEYVLAAKRLGEAQKQRTYREKDHEKIDYLVDLYSRKMAEWINAHNRNRASCPSVLISGAGNFPTRKKEKQNRRDDALMHEYGEIQKILDKIRSVGTGGISADDDDASERLAEKIAKLEKKQADMKAVNAYFRKHKTLKGCEVFCAETCEKIEAAMKSATLYPDIPFAPFELSANLANIKRLKGRLAEIEKRDNTDWQGWDFAGGHAEINREANRLQLIFDDKPDEDIRNSLKKNGFRWSPRYGAWQRQLNENTMWAVRRIGFLAPIGTQIRRKTNE